MNAHHPERPPRAGFLVLALALALSALPASADICGYAEQGELAVVREGRTVATFRVGLAENRAQYRQGLMGCTRLSAGSGLLFIYPAAERHVFWMKDTPLELAIVFAAADGRVKAIERGEPRSTRRIPSPDGIQFVLEINYGEAGRIRVGDRLVLALPLR